MEVLTLDKDLEPAYDAFVRGHEHALFYHSLKYKRFLEDLLGCGAHYLLAAEGGALRGVLPIMRTSGGFGKVYNSLPFYGSNGGPLTSGETAHAALIGAYNELISAPDVASATVVSNPLEPEACNGIAFDLEDSRIGQLTDLLLGDDPEAQMLKAIDSSARRNIRKAERSGVQVTVDNTKLDFLRDTHFDNMRAIGGTPKPERFFSLVPEHFEGGLDYNIYYAEMDGKPVAAFLLFYFNGVVEYFTPVVVNEYRTFQPLALIVFRAMLDAFEGGCRLWNWGGTWTSQEGVYRFKAKWSAKDMIYRYYVRVGNRDISAGTADSLLLEYPYFYVIPFGELESEG